jgi:S-adenosyl-L-methionine hydrolase (adenosine-forming)
VPPIITLTTDFGVGSSYVAALKGVVLSIHPEVRLVDLSHAIEPQQIAQAALLLAETALLFPPGTIHLAVVDPGVGTSRRIVAVEIEGHWFICPDNGILGRLLQKCHKDQAGPPAKMFEITSERYFRQPVAPTFHGRDIMAPAAAHLSLGVAPEELGQPLSSLQQLDWPGVVMRANRLAGEVVAVDSFGNLVTNITGDQLQGLPVDTGLSVLCAGHETRGLFTTYADQPAMTLMALVGSNGHLELAIVGDHASRMLGIRVGAEVVIEW